MPSHQERRRRLYSECHESGGSTVVSTALIKTFEKDLKYLLDETEHDYANGEMTQVRRRLRRALGDMD